MPTLMKAHLSDGALVRLLDGETDAPEREHAEAHLAQCIECGARREVLERRSTRLAELLREADYDPPAVPVIAPAAATDELAIRRARRTSSAERQPWLTAAATVMLLSGLGLATSPARAWVAEWIGERWAEVARLWAPEDAAAPAWPAPTKAATRIDFTVRGGDFMLSFSAPQRAGAVVFTLVEGAGASIEARTTGPAPDVLVLPDGVRIQNTASTAAEYRVTLPAHTRRVRLQVGEDTPVWLTVDELRERVRVGLMERTDPSVSDRADDTNTPF